MEIPVNPEPVAATGDPDRAAVLSAFLVEAAQVVSSIVVQAGAGRSLVRDDPQGAERVIREAERAGGRLVKEIRRVVEANPADGVATASAARRL